MTYIDELTKKIIDGYLISKEEALLLVDQPIDELTSNANKIRQHFCSNIFDMCVIINGKCGKCSENCKFCAQSTNNKNDVDSHALVSKEEILQDAKYNSDKGIVRYSIVTNGRKLSSKDLSQVCEYVKDIHKDNDIEVCGSFGLLEYDDFVRLKESGVSRIHNNLETSRNNFPNICTSHTYDDKVKSIKNAIKAGLNVCSGGVMGIGETYSDRIDMVFDIRELGIRSIPVNMLNPIKGTPFSDLEILTNDDMCRIVAIFRFIIPNASIRMAGGRGLLPDKGKKCFLSGANAAITGDMLTTSGISIETDKEIVKELGYEVALWT